jgi:glutamine phosphoribosylpyrophosphate amidotransferase
VTYFGLYALQHQGQEARASPWRAAGISAPRMGVRCLDNHLEVEGCCGIGRVRCSTGSSILATRSRSSSVTAKARRRRGGNITSAHILREEPNRRVHLPVDDGQRNHTAPFRQKTNHGFGRLVRSVKRLEGAFSFVMLTSRGEVSLRDPHGFSRCSGKLGGSYATTEGCASTCRSSVRARDQPGKRHHYHRRHSDIRTPASRRRACIPVHLTCATDTHDGRNVYLVRQAFGAGSPGSAGGADFAAVSGFRDLRGGGSRRIRHSLQSG